MNTPINNGGSAFPSHESPSDGWLPSGGMTLRDYFAAKALLSITSTANAFTASCDTAKEAGIPLHDGLARMSYEIADAMLRAREQSQP